MNDAVRIGILGGTLDPIHTGHLDAALAAREALALDRVLVIPAHVPPHRGHPVSSPALAASAETPEQVEIAENTVEGVRRRDSVLVGLLVGGSRDAGLSVARGLLELHRCHSSSQGKGSACRSMS